ncbi:MAG: efflux RND transporter permease subunit, partial [Magnetococcales bacterium]|nr:efflux RND transporter permease subunit [Magnetococcales bacterium]
MLRILYRNHVAANLTFVLILVIGLLCYQLLPRQQDPDMNFNWISIITFLPGAAAEDVERQVTDPLEEAIQRVSDIYFVLSSSRGGNSEILVRFNDIDERTFDKRVSDLRREVQNKKRELPTEAEEPIIMEITSSNSYPTVMVLVQGEEEDENLRLQARHVKKGLERLPGVDLVTATGLHDPELQIRFAPTLLSNF